MPDSEIILKRASELFFSYGYSRVSTQEIAARAGISKKTLYQHFPSKKDILLQVVRLQMEEVRRPLEAAFDQPDLDFITRTRRILEIVSALFVRIGSGLIQDIYRSAPEIWQEIDDFRRRNFFSRLEQHIRQGHARGIIRPDLDPDLIVRIFLHIIQHLVTPEQLIDLSLSARELMESLVKIFFTGVLTEPAREALFTNRKEPNHENA